MMGPNCVVILEELLNKYPLKVGTDDLVLDLGCGKGLSSLVIAKETGAKVYAVDLWITEQENWKRFSEWSIDDKVTPICEDANNLRFEERIFSAMISIDSYHYFGGEVGFFQEKILPLLKDGGEVLIGIPGVKDEYAAQVEELLSDWLGDDAKMFKSPKTWKGLIGENERIDSVVTWEMDGFEAAWVDWLTIGNEHAYKDMLYYERIIKPYTCLVGIYVKLKG